MNLFKCDISGFDALEAEVKAEYGKIYARIPIGLATVGAEMIVKLKEHIAEDWYTQYQPRKYKRRTDDPSLGTPLGSDENIDVIMGRGSTPDLMQMIFIYEPTGEHQNPKWSKRNDDELIEFLQLGNLKKGFPPRPFWNNFVRNVEHGIFPIFSDAMAPYRLIPDGTDNLDLSEFLLAEGTNQMSIDFGDYDGFSSDNSDTLPF